MGQVSSPGVLMCAFVFWLGEQGHALTGCTFAGNESPLQHLSRTLLDVFAAVLRIRQIGV